MHKTEKEQRPSKKTGSWWTHPVQYRTYGQNYNHHHKHPKVNRLNIQSDLKVCVPHYNLPMPHVMHVQLHDENTSGLTLAHLQSHNWTKDLKSITIIMNSFFSSSVTYDNIRQIRCSNMLCWMKFMNKKQKTHKRYFIHKATFAKGLNTQAQKLPQYMVSSIFSFFFFLHQHLRPFCCSQTHTMIHGICNSHKVPCARDNTREKRKAKRMPCWSLPWRRWGKESDHRPSWRKTPVHVTLYWQWHLSLIHIWRCRRVSQCRSRWSPYH